MIDFLKRFMHVLVSPFKSQARLEAESLFLRHQLNVLRRRAPSKTRLIVADRLIFVGLFRLFPSVLSTVTVTHPTRHSAASGRLPALLTLEVTLSRWAAESSREDPPPDSRYEFNQFTLGRFAHPW